jgi:hypothetical protein
VRETATLALVRLRTSWNLTLVTIFPLGALRRELMGGLTQRVSANFMELGQSADFNGGCQSFQLICPLLGGPKSMLFWIMKEIGNAIEEAQAGGDYRQAA